VIIGCKLYKLCPHCRGWPVMLRNTGESVVAVEIFVLIGAQRPTVERSSENAPLEWFRWRDLEYASGLPQRVHWRKNS